MRASKGVRWRPVVGVLALGVFAFSLTLQGEPQVRKDARVKSAVVPEVTASTAVSAPQNVRIGPGVPVDLPVYPPVVVDYRNDSTSRGGLVTPVMGGKVAAPLDACLVNAECDDCNPCTVDLCRTGTCEDDGGTGVDQYAGRGCNNDEQCGGSCTGGNTPGEWCLGDLDCCGPTGGGPHGVCTFFTCVDLVDAGDPDNGYCSNWTIPDKCVDGDRDGEICDSVNAGADTDCSPGGGTCEPAFEKYSECDDQLFCNGLETCDAGICDPGDPPCDPLPDTLQCDEDSDSCPIKCTADWHCDIDGNVCSADKCDLSGTITGEIGQCYTENPCGPGGGCTEPSSGSTPICDTGRCCHAGEVCQETLYEDCDDAGDMWFSTDDACDTIGNTPNRNNCPAYSAAIAPQGDFLVEVGRITGASQCPDYTAQRLGDDYEVDSSILTDYMAVSIVRFVASVQVGARIAVEFWDPNGECPGGECDYTGGTPGACSGGDNNGNPCQPRFIEDTFYPPLSNVGAAGPGIHTLLLDPFLTVPRKGIFALSIATNFGPQGAVSLLSTDVEDVGTNLANVLFIQRPGDALPIVDTTGMLGVCTGGYRDGRWCDRNAALATQCPNGTSCDDIADVLAFELVGPSGGDPQGACCVAADGTCNKLLPWICKAQGNVFQGGGTGCKVCQLDPFGPECNDSGDCTQLCENGTTACTQDSPDCDGIGSGRCDICVDVPPACLTQACCDNDGAGYGDCLERVDPETCPVGTTSLGYGSFCEGDEFKAPNCCEPETFSNQADNCLDLDPIQVTVPSTGQVQYTVQGHTGAATFDDYTVGRFCDGGDLDGEECCPGGLCDTGVSDLCVAGSRDTLECCPNGGTCTVVTDEAGIFDPEQFTQDPGWWTGFSVDACAHVRIETCCSEVIDPITGPSPVRPAWASMSVGCPADGNISQEGLPDPIGEGWGTAGHARGGPFCPSDDNSWGTYGPLARGVYYYPIYSGWQGTYATINGGATYFFHVTAMACPEAACCGKTCESGTRAGLLCDDAGIPACPNGECVAGFCENGDLHGYACDVGTGAVDQCPGGACTGATGCDKLNQLVCEALGGFWLAGLNLPEGAPPTDDCSSDPCDVGACCVGPGDCREEDALGVRMTETECESLSDDAEFVGASACFDEADLTYPDWVPPTGPCPVCPARGDPANCQPPDANWGYTMDRQLGLRLMDDFQATGPTISEFCFKPCFIQETWTGANIGECSDLQRDGAAPPPDDFIIRFYEEDPNNPGFPGDELADSPGTTAVEIAAKAWDEGNSRCWDYSVVFDPPIGGFATGSRYFIEFSGKGNPSPPEGDGCHSFLLGSLQGNAWAFQSGDHYGDESWSVNDLLATVDGSDPYDTAFCIDTGIVVAPPPTGACCRCDGNCTNGEWGDCLAVFDLDPLEYITQTVGDFIPGKTCLDLVGTPEECLPVVTGGCEPGGEPGAICSNPFDISAFPVYDFSNLCSGLSGVGTYDTCDTGDDLRVTSDVWFAYYSCASEKRIDIDMCDSFFDAIMGVYVNYKCVSGTRDGLPCTQADQTCPGGDCRAAAVCNGGTLNGTDCTDPAAATACVVAGGACVGECPTPETMLCEGGDNSGQDCTLNPTLCDPGGGACTGYDCKDGSLEADYLVNGMCYEDECNPHGATVSLYADIDKQCFLIRVGGDVTPEDEGNRNPAGLGSIEVGCGGCFPSSVPEPERLYIASETPSDPINQKIRGLSFYAGDAGRLQAIRVTFKNLPVPYNGWSGLEMWVGPPELQDPVHDIQFHGRQTYCENSGFDVPWVAPGNVCPFAGKNLPIEFAASTLQCDPYFADWAQGYCLGGPNAGDDCSVNIDCPGLGTCVENVCVGGDNDGGFCDPNAQCSGHTCSDGVVHVFHEGIVPTRGTVVGPPYVLEVDPAQYLIEVVEIGCSLAAEDSYSLPIEIQQSLWGDLVEDLGTEPARPPLPPAIGAVSLAFDVTALVDKFANKAGNEPVTSMRADVSPMILDKKIGMATDVTFVLDAFKGGNYPPAALGDPSAPPCGHVP